MRIEYHRTLIADRARNESFALALKSGIKPGETVVADIGAGTGLLGLIAWKFGAKEVYLYEAAEVAGVAAQALKSNRAKNCHLFPCHSTEMEEPPRADVIVSETLGNYALEENIVDTLNDAHRRHLKPGGIVIPSRLRQIAAPVITKRIHEELSVWDGVGHGLDMPAAKAMSLNNVYVRTLAMGELLDEGRSAKVWDEIDLSRENRSTRKGELTWTAKRSIKIYGFAVWWAAELVPGIELGTGPQDPRTHWEQLYFPLLSPINLDPAHSLKLTLRSRSSEEAGTHLAWTAVLQDAQGKALERQALDLDKGWIR